MAGYVIWYSDNIAPNDDDITQYVEKFDMDIELDIEDLHVGVYNGISLKVHRNDSVFTILNGGFIEVYYVTDTPTTIYYFTGYVQNLEYDDKNGLWEFDVISEIDFLANESIDSSPSGSTILARLQDQLPSGYSVQAMDATATAALAQAPTGLTSLTYSDHNFTDLLYDTMLILNGLTNTDYFYCLIVNKVIQIYGDHSSVALTDDKIIEWKHPLDFVTYGLPYDPVYRYYQDEINNHLRADGGSLSIGTGATYTYYKYFHKFTLTERLKIFDELTYSSVSKGFIVSIEKSGSLYKYKTMILESV